MDKKKQDTFFYGSVIVAACFSIQSIGIGTLASYGVFFNPLIAEFGWSRATISGAYSMAFLLMGLLGIIVGRLNDRIGPRKLMTVTGISFGLGFLLMSRLDAIWQLYLFYGGVVGIGLSSIDVIPLTTTARWFVRKRGIMTGIVKVGTGAGQFAIPLIASMLIMRFGWRTSYLIIGAAVMIILVSVAQLLKRDPSQIGLMPDGEEEKLGDKPDGGAGGFSLNEALHTRQFWTICGVSVAIVFCLMSIIVHIVPHAQDIRISAARAASVLAVIGGVSMAGRFITGITIDRIGSKRAMICCFGLLIAGLVWLQTAHGLWMLYLFAMVYGIAHGGFFTAISPIVAEFFGIRAHGVLFGIIAFSGTVGGAMGPVVTGYIFDVTAGYSLAFWLCVLMSVLGLALIISLQPIKERVTV
jgi:MFS family permease